MKGRARPSITSKIPQKEEDIKRTQMRQIAKWASAASEHLHLYCPPTHTSNNHYYQIEFYQVADIQVLLGKRKQYIQITCILFNKKTQAFIGSTYSSQMFEVEAKSSSKPVCSCKKSVFFYTDQDDMALKVDLWRLQSEKNGKGIENMSKRFYLGHFEVELTESRPSGIIEKSLTNVETIRFFSAEQIQQRTQMSQEEGKKKMPKIVYRVMNTHSLSHLHHFIPANHIFDEHSRILGLRDMKIGSKGEIQMGDRSRLTFQLKTLTVPLTILKYLTDVAATKINSQSFISGRPSISIKEMRLNFEFHNGWKIVCSQSIILKEYGAQVGGNDTNRSSIPSKIVSKVQSKMTKGRQQVTKEKVYTYDKSKELKAVFVGDGALIIWIEAKIQSRFDALESGSKKEKSEVFFLPIAFALKTLPQFEEETNCNFSLFLGNPFNLSCLLDYFSQLKTKLEEEENLSDKVICNMVLMLQKSGGTIDNIETVEKQMNQIQNLKIQKERLARLKRKVREEKRKKLIELNQEIPFLDTTQLKEGLYEEKLARVKNQKLEQEEILFFLRAKMNQLERETFKNELNMQEIEDQDAFSPNKVNVKKLPPHFVDYRHEPSSTNISQSTMLNYFNSKYYKLAISPIKQVSSKLVEEIMKEKTFLQLKIRQFECFLQQISAYTLMIPNFQGSFETIAVTSFEYSNKSLQIHIGLSRQKTTNILNNLLNGFFQINLLCNSNQNLKASSLITASQLVDKCNSGDLLESITEKVIFTQQGTPIAYVSFIISFTNSYNTSTGNSIKDQKVHQASISTQLSPINRIQRFKEEKGIKDKKKERVDQILSGQKINRIFIEYRQCRPYRFSISIRNTLSVRKLFQIYIFDADSHYLQGQELQIMMNPHLFTSKSDKKIEVQPNSSQQIQFTYYSERISMNSQMMERINKQRVQDLYKKYNHEHKININIIQKESNIIIDRYQVIIRPQFCCNNLVISKFIGKEEYYSLPIPNINLQLSNPNKDIIQSATSLTINIPKLKEDVYLTHLQLTKKPKECGLIFQRIQFFGWKCQCIQFTARLWQSKEVLLKLPLQSILNEQISLPYLIQDLIISSHHVNLKIKQLGSFVYTSQLKVNRKMSEIYIRGQVMSNQVGKFTYGVEIANKDNHVFHRLGITSCVEFPILTANQIIPIKISKKNHDVIEQKISFTNKEQVGIQFVIKSNHPHLMAFKEGRRFLKRDQQWKIQMNFNWERMMDEMAEQSKQQISILVGVKSSLSIQYFMVKCRQS